MPELLLHGRPVETLFDLLGDDENDMSAALGYALARSSAFLRGVVADIMEGSPPVDIHQAIVTLQTIRGKGITDVEVRIGDHTHLILEAKRGPVLPTEAQLGKYAPVLAGSVARSRALVTITNVSPQAAAVSGFPDEMLGIPVVHRSWRRLRDLAIQARPGETHAAKQLLDQFTTYLGAILGMENRYSNMVYVVSLGPDVPSGWTLSWRDIVRERERYFYPVGKRWPEPPNYIAFRYDGRLQHVHHVRGHEVFTNPRSIFPEGPDSTWEPHYCLELGAPIKPTSVVKSGPRVLRNNRVWCMLDTLLTADTISDAVTETKRRQAAQ